MNNFRRLLGFARSPLYRRVLPAAIGGFGTYMLLQADPSNFLRGGVTFSRNFASFPIMTTQAEAKFKCQDLVVSEDKTNGLFLILHIHPTASPHECIKALQKLQAHIDRVSPVDIRDEDSEIIMSIAFGADFLSKVYPDAVSKGVEPYPFNERKGKSSLMPATGGDILIHAACGEKGKLFELVQAVLGDMPEKAVQRVEEVYGFVYRNGRDLSGFIDGSKIDMNLVADCPEIYLIPSLLHFVAIGTENPADEDERIEVAVSSKTGGSYVLTQRWIHDLRKIATESEKAMEAHIGRTRPDSIEIKPVQPTSHVGRMTHGLSEEAAEERRIVRHSMPYGEASRECGLFFIAYAKSPETLDWMLDRMAGLTHDSIEDALFHFTRPVTGAYFYSPSKAELEEIFAKMGHKRGGLW
ncbi:unnamed protein product [Mesocestoides corti]|uniref:Dyp-type peroxidase n=1 Tax=Mesocestoides corti TaxID=53468 RepID=A0A0R3UKS5_MESCO|nr:unnamed protein product [Mesocestoides corti]